MTEFYLKIKKELRYKARYVFISGFTFTCSIMEPTVLESNYSPDFEEVYSIVKMYFSSLKCINIISMISQKYGVLKSEFSKTNCHVRNVRVCV